MTSTYPRPFFFAFAVPFLPPALGGPRRSSILLALLILVPGLLLGAEEPAALPFDTLLLMGGGAISSLAAGGVPPRLSARPSFPGALDVKRAREGGGPEADIGRGAEVGPLGVPVGPTAPDTARRGPVAFGGGGVAVGVGVSSAPAFLLTQRFKSGS